MAGVDEFSNKKVPQLQDFLAKRGIQHSNKRRNELLELCRNAKEMKIDIIQSDETAEETIISKLQTDDNPLPNPSTVVAGWTKSFSSAPPFSFPDLFTYLVDNKGYDKEALKAYKSLQGYRLYADGHVEELLFNPLLEQPNYCMIKFNVKPTEKSKTQDGKRVYNGWVIMKKDGVVHSGYCTCQGG
ncbi:MAG: hypothetical protein DSY43_00700 [Gammaproteobacteria bacterium]|nr:MAG: hypothetical protein DSY43_00700 [Gammaproteobacteria bacterium]